MNILKQKRKELISIIEEKLVGITEQELGITITLKHLKEFDELKSIINKMSLKELNEVLLKLESEGK